MDAFLFESNWFCEFHLDGTFDYHECSSYLNEDGCEFLGVGVSCDC